MLKVMSKMGISTYQSYCGAQIFDAVGLRPTSSPSISPARTRGSRASQPGRRKPRRHADAFGDAQVYKTALDVGGEYAYRTRGEDHAWTAESVATLQHAVRGNSQERYRAFAKILNEQSERLLTMRGLFRIKTADDEKRKPVRSIRSSLPARIVKRFATGAMSFGSISREAHTTLAIAMNRIGGKSNTGEGGEEPTASSRCRTAIDALGDQAGRLGPLRRDDGISRQLRHDADQDGAGRQARRRRPVARPQGRRDDRARAALDAGRRPDLAAAASRHLFDRGPGAAHLRPQERQS